MKVKGKNFIIQVVIYPFKVMVSLNQTYDQFAADVMRNWDASILDGFKKDENILWQGRTGIFTEVKHRCVLIKIEDFKKDADGYATLVHEITHAAEFILRSCGFHLNENSYEAYSYLTGFLTQEIFKKIL